MARIARGVVPNFEYAYTLYVSRILRYINRMIEGYADRRTEGFGSGERIKAFSGFERQAERRLAILNAATTLESLSALKSNRLEALSGNRKGQYSIRINQQWRLCFAWNDGDAGPSRVEIVDYH